MANIKTKRKRVKFASDNVAGACPEVLEAIIKANEGDSTPYGNDPISKDLQDKFSEIFEKKVIVFPECAFQSNAEADPTKSNEIEKKIENNLDNIVTPIIEWI